MSTPKSSGELTYKQKKFCEYYIVSHNATESAIKAGYSEKTARTQGAENLAKPYIKNYIAELEGKAVARATQGAIASRQEILEFYTTMMRNPDVSSKDRLKSASLLGEYYALAKSNETDGKAELPTVQIVFKDLSGGEQ